MSKVTFTPCLKKKFTRDNYGILNIRVTKERKSTYYPVTSGETLSVDLWNKKQKEIRNNKSKITDEERDRLTGLIEKKINELKTIFKTNPKEIEDIKLNDKKSYLKFLLDEVNHLETNRKIGTSKRYKTTYYHLKGFLSTRNKSDLLFSEIDTLFVQLTYI